ncbi:hypothetical protein AVEN_167916-1 [Araneus ventricosus]|uniref:Uncharacterized protein n=1 Tax=Araneus ventricosus TaxID=182803 RepID=A0A4Y2FWC8_ARAVE|nr:hypothetical protein AVEN_167916-1 [Araneus ventricosus]
MNSCPGRHSRPGGRKRWTLQPGDVTPTHSPCHYFAEDDGKVLPHISSDLENFISPRRNRPPPKARLPTRARKQLNRRSPDPTIGRTAAIPTHIFAVKYSIRMRWRLLRSKPERVDERLGILVARSACEHGLTSGGGIGPANSDAR